MEYLIQRFNLFTQIILRFNEGLYRVQYYTLFNHFVYLKNILFGTLFRVTLMIFLCSRFLVYIPVTVSDRILKGLSNAEEEEWRALNNKQNKSETYLGSNKSKVIKRLHLNEPVIEDGHLFRESSQETYCE